MQPEQREFVDAQVVNYSLFDRVGLSSLQGIHTKFLQRLCATALPRVRERAPRLHRRDLSSRASSEAPCILS